VEDIRRDLPSTASPFPKAAIDATNGPHWSPITETLGSLSIGALAMSPVNPDSLLVGLGDPFDVQVPGFFHSDDGGASWLGPVVLSGTYPGFAPLQASSVRDIAYDATGQVVLAATDVGLFRSAEGGVGTGWTLIDPDVGHAPQAFWSVDRVGGQVWNRHLAGPDRYEPGRARLAQHRRWDQLGEDH
jgi:hypothetical protein